MPTSNATVRATHLGPTRRSSQDREAIRVREIEARHIRVDPDGEREEVRQIYEAIRFAGPELERVVELITADNERWIDTMIAEEYGLPREIRSPLRAASVTFVAFLVCGLVPLIPFLVVRERSFAVASVATCAIFFLIGSVKAKWSTASWWRSGLETLAIGGFAAILAYAAGAVIRGFVS